MFLVGLDWCKGCARRVWSSTHACEMHIVTCCLTCGGSKDERSMKDRGNTPITAAKQSTAEGLVSYYRPYHRDSHERSRVNPQLAWHTPCCIHSLLKVSYGYVAPIFGQIVVTKRQITNTCNRKFMVLAAPSLARLCTPGTLMLKVIM